MSRLILPTLLLAAAIPLTTAADAVDRGMTTAKDLAKTFDMQQQVGWCTVLFVVRQEGNRYPAIWAGRLEGGTFAFSTDYDLLDDSMAIESEGGFTLRVSAIPDRHGLEEIIPMQALVGDLRNVPLRVELADFKDWELLQDEDEGTQKKKKSKGRGGYRTRAHCTAIVHHGDTKVAFPGQTMEFNHSLEDGRLRFDVQLQIDGAKLALPESQRGPLVMRINTVGPPAALKGLGE